VLGALVGLRVGVNKITGLGVLTLLTLLLLLGLCKGGGVGKSGFCLLDLLPVLLPLLELLLSLLPLLLLPHVFVVVGMVDIILLGRLPLFGTSLELLRLLPHALVVGAGDALGKIVFLLDRLLRFGYLYLAILWGPSNPMPLPPELAFGDPLPRIMLSAPSDSPSFLSFRNEKKSSMLSLSRGRLSFCSTFANWTEAESSALPTICRML